MRPPSKEIIYTIVCDWICHKEFDHVIGLSDEERQILTQTFYSLSEKVRKIEGIERRSMIAILLALSQIIWSYYWAYDRNKEVKLVYPPYRLAKEEYNISGKPVRKCMDFLHKIFKTELGEMLEKLKQLKLPFCSAPSYISCMYFFNRKGKVACRLPTYFATKKCPFIVYEKRGRNRTI